MLGLGGGPFGSWGNWLRAILVVGDWGHGRVGCGLPGADVRVQGDDPLGLLGCGARGGLVMAQSRGVLALVDDSRTLEVLGGGAC